MQQNMISARNMLTAKLSKKSDGPWEVVDFYNSGLYIRAVAVNPNGKIVRFWTSLSGHELWKQA